MELYYMNILSNGHFLIKLYTFMLSLPRTLQDFFKLDFPHIYMEICLHDITLNKQQHKNVITFQNTPLEQEEI